MGRRIDDRLPAELPIRIWGMDSTGHPFSSQARTIDITRTGARIAGIDHICQKGDVIGIQHGEQKARFRVVWVGTPGSAKAGQVGVHCVESGKYIWGVQLPERKWSIDPHPIPGMGGVVSLADNIVPRTPPGMAPSRSPAVKPGARRVHRRVSCTGSIAITPEAGTTTIQALLSDISASGCYAELGNPLPVNTRIQFDMHIRQRELRGHGIVRQCHPGVGMGISFTDMSAHDRELLGTIVNSLDHAIAVSKPDRLAKAMAAAKEGIPTHPSSRRLGPPIAEPTVPTPTPPSPTLRSKLSSPKAAAIPDISARSSGSDVTPPPKFDTPPPTTTPVPPSSMRGKTQSQESVSTSSSRQNALSQEPTLLQKLSHIRAEFNDLHEELIADHVDPRLAQDFKDSIDHARQAAWTLEQWIQLEAEKHDPYDVMPHLDAERVKHTHRLAKRLAVGIDATEIGDHTGGLDELFSAIDELRTRLARLLKKEIPKDKELKSNLRGSDTTSIF
jgi:PilZ domain